MSRPCRNGTGGCGRGLRLRTAKCLSKGEKTALSAVAPEVWGAGVDVGVQALLCGCSHTSTPSGGFQARRGLGQWTVKLPPFTNGTSNTRGDTTLLARLTPTAPPPTPRPSPPRPPLAQASAPGCPAPQAACPGTLLSSLCHLLPGPVLSPLQG